MAITLGIRETSDPNPGEIRQAYPVRVRGRQIVDRVGVNQVDGGFSTDWPHWKAGLAFGA
jgi:hypothetical protein